ncbi:hypothetical protein D1007_23070 [Hordeum vulgare]|nr:hypothetical protein D1007_23070 [Hordeum vulgare]
MVFEDESIDDQSTLPYMHSSNSSTDGIYHEGDNCGFVEWVDQEWPITMQNALLKLWAMFEDTRNGRVTDNLESALTIHHLTQEKKNLDANYEKLVKDVHDLIDFQEERVIGFSYLQSNLTYQQQRRSKVVADMKGHMAKKDEDHKHLNNKYELLVNLTRAQAAVIQNLKLKHIKEKQVHSEAMEKLELKNAELTKSEEKLTQEKLELKFQIAGLLKGKEVHSEDRGHLEL